MPPTDIDELEATWGAVHDALPPGCTVQRPSRHDEEREQPWHVFATDLRQRAPGRRRRPERRSARRDGINQAAQGVPGRPRRDAELVGRAGDRGAWPADRLEHLELAG